MSGRAWSAAGVIGLGRAVLAALLALALLSPAVAQQATYNYEVPSGQFKRVRIINVSEGTVLAVLVKLDGQMDVLVAYGETADRAEQDDKAPAPARPLLRVQAVKQLSFSVRAPLAGQYFVVLDNRKGTAPQAVEVTIAVQRPAAPRKPSKEPNKEKKEEPRPFPRS